MMLICSDIKHVACFIVIYRFELCQKVILLYCASAFGVTER